MKNLKIKDFCATKVNKLTKQEEVFITFKTSKGLTLKIFKELPQIKKSTRKSQEAPKKVIISHSQLTHRKSWRHTRDARN